jgi:NitT/TauT family transport system substrate-binding protein
MRRQARLAAVCIGLSLAMAAGCASSDGTSRGGPAARTTTVSYAGVREQGSAGFAAALLQGDFARQGLAFAPTWATSGSVILQAVVGGSVDVANLGPSQLYEAVQNGACAQVLRPTEGAAYGLIAQPRLNLDSALPFPDVLKQLKGLTIGVAARGAAQELVVGALLKAAGVNPQTGVSWVAIGSGAAAVAAFASDKVDVVVSYSQLEVNLQANGTPFDELLNLSGPHTPLGTFWQAVAVANCAWADHHRGTVLKFCHALNQGFAALTNDPVAGPEAFAYLHLGTTLDQSTALWSKYNDPVVRIPPLDRQDWAYQARFTSDDYTPSYSAHVVNGCATA